MDIAHYDEIEPFITKDGSEIREWAGRAAAPAVNQSLAEASLPPGGATTEHFHRLSEELYLVTAGAGRLRRAAERRPLASQPVQRAAGVTRAIPTMVWEIMAADQTS